MAAGLHFSLFSILLLFVSRRHFYSNFSSLSKPNNVIFTEEPGLYKDVYFSVLYEPVLPWRVKIFRIEFSSETKVSFAVVRSAKHGVTSLALPAKLFVVDLTICVDISHNPSPDFQNGSRISDNHEFCVRSDSTRMAALVGDCNNKLKSGCL